jgi:hypothetical protein
MVRQLKTPRNVIEAVMKRHILAEARLIGAYQKTR